MPNIVGTKARKANVQRLAQLLDLNAEALEEELEDIAEASSCVIVHVVRKWCAYLH